MDKTIVIIVILIFVAGFLFWGFRSGFFVSVFSGPVNSVTIPEGIILFYGDGCPHCKIVDDFIPGKYYAQFGEGEQDMFITEIESDIQLREPTTYDGRYYSDDEQEDYPDEENDLP
jgi:hypothetical protein